MVMKSKMVCDIQGSLKFSMPSRSVGLSWVYPIHLFANMFNQFTFTQTPTMFVCKEVRCEDMVALLGEHWNIVEGMHKGDTFKCNVVESSVAFRYLKSRATLCTRFYYER